MLDIPGNEKKVNEHYSHGKLATAIFNALRTTGKYQDLTEDDLMPADQFHIGGKSATLELAKLAKVNSKMRILDVGGGIGGPARTLATTYGCRVEVLDLSEEYCKVGEELTIKTGLRDLVTFKHGSALDLPYSHASFDLVWTQHSSMNIADKERLYSEIFRVLTVQGKLAIHEIMAGENKPVHFPVPWARHPAISYLMQPDKMRELIISKGFSEICWADETKDDMEVFHKINELPASASSPLSLQILLGIDYKEMMLNQLKNLEESRISVFKGVFEKLK